NGTETVALPSGPKSSEKRPIPQVFAWSPHTAATPAADGAERKSACPRGGRRLLPPPSSVGQCAAPTHKGPARGPCAAMPRALLLAHRRQVGAHAFGDFGGHADRFAQGGVRVD